MEILVAKEAGFCFGVKRAIDLALKTNEDQIKFNTFGEIIHNKQVVSMLDDLGIHAIEDLKSIQYNTIFIRSHGVPKKFYEEAQALGLQIIDGTCPYVKKIHKLAEKYSQLGYAIIIIGDENHPEVMGIKGWSEGPVYVVNSKEAVSSIPKEIKKACVVAQTTITEEKWEQVLSEVQTHIIDLVIENTICEATRVRQQAAEELSRDVDMMLVIGGKHSSNSIKLYEVCKKNCKNTYHIETINEIQMINFVNCDKIGITAGASTPDWIINEILNALKQMH